MGDREAASEMTGPEAKRMSRESSMHGARKTMMSKPMAKMTWACGASVILACVSVAPGQTASGKDDQGMGSGSGQPKTIVPRGNGAVRPSVVDLTEMAKERRPGQVLHGDPAPYGTAAVRPMPEQTSSAPPANGAEAPPMTSKPSVGLPDTAPETKARIKPLIDAGPRSNGGEAMADAPTRNPVAEAAMVSSLVVQLGPGAVSSGPAHVSVESAGGAGNGAPDAQWRVGGGTWKIPAAGEAVDGSVEVRAGLEGELVLVVDDRAQVRISRLGRAAIDRSTDPMGIQTVSVNVSRGAIEVRPAGKSGEAGASGGGKMYARIRTPDQSFGLTGAMRVEYDAFTGTRRRVVNP
jgi:hypothetical protein